MSKIDIEMLRHSMSHVLAKAIMTLYKGTKLAIGPAIDNGFYYDIDSNHIISNEDFEKIENEMREIIKSNADFKKEVISKNEALKLFADNEYKIELIKDLPENEVISVYYLGDDFVDLCRGPHVENTKFLKSFAFKSNRVSGAYWRGNVKNKMLQRIYMFGFASFDELKSHIKMLEEAVKRDHRKLGKELGLYFISEYAPGMPFYMPNGLILKNQLIEYWREMHKKAGYEEIETPNALNNKLWEVSGHWGHYKQNMYTFHADDNDEYAIKPMNCPGGMLYYKENIHSYKDLPLRVAELGKVHRKEASGTLHGLMRVRAFTQDDAHIFMLPSQIISEVKGVIDLVDKMYKVFNLEYHLELSTMPENHIGDIKDWVVAENALKEALNVISQDYVINEGDGAFYGPKIDVHIKDAIGRTWQCATIQLDMQMPKRFNLEYVDSDGTKKEPVMIHRVIYGAVDRFIGIIIENFAGAFPTWLAPVQVKVLTITDKNEEYARKVVKTLEENNVRVESDFRNDSINKKVRSAQVAKIPYTLVIGDQEIENNTVSVRERGKNETTVKNLNEFIKEIVDEIKQKKI